MADLQTEFYHEQVEGSTYDLIPVGDYLAQIVSSEVVPPKSGNGLMLKLRWDILDGGYEGRCIFDQINYMHANPQAQLIGQQQLKAICEAVGITGPLKDSEDLHFKPCKIKVGIQKDKDGRYDDRNTVKSVKPATGTIEPRQGTPGAAGRPTMPPAAAAAASRQTPAGRPWGNRGA